MVVLFTLDIAKPKLQCKEFSHGKIIDDNIVRIIRDCDFESLHSPDLKIWMTC